MSREVSGAEIEWMDTPSMVLALVGLACSRLNASYTSAASERLSAMMVASIRTEAAA